MYEATCSLPSTERSKFSLAVVSTAHPGAIVKSKMAAVLSASARIPLRRGIVGTSKV